MEPLNTRDMHIAVELSDGTTHLVKRRNPHQVAWEVYAHQKDLPAGGTLALTYQAWHALRFSGVDVGSFTSWSDDVDDVYPAAPDGTRLVVHKGKLCVPSPEDDDAQEPEKVVDEPRPTKPGRESGT